MAKLSDRAWLWILLLVGLVIRLIYYIKYSTLLEFDLPTVDALYHHLLAKSIASGALTATEPFFRAPLYTYFLGFIYWVTSDSIGAARFIQVLIGSATAPLVFLISKEVFDRRAAVLASLLVLLCQDVVYFEAELLLESILMTLILLSFYFLLRHLVSGKFAPLLMAGLMAGLASVTRPNALVILLPAIWLLWKGESSISDSHRLRKALIFLVMALIPVGIVLTHNLTRSEPALAIATQGGINFYIGNNRDADGVSAVMPGNLGYNWQYEDVSFLAEKSEGRMLTPSEVSDYYYDAAFQDIAGDPVRWVGLLAKKAYLFFSGADISNNRNLTYFKSQFAILKILPIGMWLLGPLALMSLLLWPRLGNRARAVVSFVLLYSASLVLFFVNSRFRLPVLPLLSCLTGGAVFLLWDPLRAGRRIPALPIAIVGVVLLVTLNLNLYAIQFDNRKQALFTEGNLQLRANSIDEAISTYRRADELPGTLKDLSLNMGVAFLRKQDYDSAWKYLLIEDSLTGGSAEALSNLAYLYRQTKQYDQAVMSARLALEEKPYLADARLNLWYAWRESGKPESVLVDAAELSGTRQLSEKEKFLKAVSESDLNRFQEAAIELSELLTRESNNQQPSYSEAASTFGLSLNPGVSPAHLRYNLGYALAGMGMIDSAIVLFKQALEFDSNLQEAWVNLGTAYLNKRQFVDAVGAYQSALRIGPESEILLYNLAIAMLSQGERLDGENYLRRALQINPDFNPAKALLEQLQADQ